MLTRLIAVFLLAGLLPACSTATIGNEPLRLRVLSYNIKHARGEDNTFNYQRLAEVIKGAQPDLVALQEVDRETNRSGGVDQAARIGELTGMHYYFAESMPYQGGGYGNAVLTKAKPGFTTTIALPTETGQEPRSAGSVRVTEAAESGLPIYMMSTHLDHRSEQTRVKQTKHLLGLPPMSLYPIVLAGDFNFTPGSEPYNLLIDAGWADTAQVFGDPKPTHPSDKPRKRIDYVFVRPAECWRIVDVRVLDEPIASDHAPVLVELEYIRP